ncbi:MAG: ATP-dependent endonuclease [Desulfosporosinus sp. BRH_c37]|nr:MAG: ATP-dependent endonuclease [Desulfosporosinus sp. BRH_c37]
MKIRKLKICRFRCFGDEEETIQFDELTSLIGNNSSGKTAALQALLKLFSDNSGDRSFQRSDFYLPKNLKSAEMTEQNLYIEAVFNFPELKAEGEEGKYVVPVFFEHFVVEEPGGVPYLRIRVEASWEKGNNAEGSIENKIYYILCAEDEEIKEENKRSANRHDLDKIIMVYVPAVRDPSKQLRNVSGTMMYRIMESINWSEEIKTSVDTKVGELNEAFIQESGVSILKSAIHTQWKNYDADYRYTNAEMRFNNTDMNSILKKSEVVFSPSVTGKKYGIDDMGDGLRSLFYISMVDSILEVENEIRKEIAEGKEKRSFNITPPVLTIVAVEEPENHISPHLVGKLINKFKDISKRENAQTIIATHSPAIVKRIDPENIRYLRMNIDDLSTKVKIIKFPSKEKHEDKYKYVKEAVQAYPELYFAKLVVLGEGDSEEILIPKLLELCGSNIDSSGISVVPLGGRHVNHFWRLLNDLEIPFVTLLDLDMERVGGGWGRIKYVLSQLMDIGVPRDNLLQVTFTDDQFKEMHTWKLVKGDTNLLAWTNFLEGFNVFFSSPLDLDFMMLECFSHCYKDILEGNEGPYIQGKGGKEKGKEKGKISYIEVNVPSDKEYVARVANDVHCTLKENGGDGVTYSDAQKQLMVWYNYFFLNRGKPSTHILALSKINDAELKDNAPEVLKRMISRIEKFLVTIE